MPRAKASLWVILTSALTVAVLFLLPYTPAVPVRTAEAHRGDLLRSVLLSGVVSYESQQPCLNAQAGRVAKVHVRAGQRVQAGELLFSMDTSAQEAALASLERARYAQRAALGQQEAVVSALAVERELAWQEQERQLRQSIEAASIRAGMDGVLDAVYAVEGEWVEAGSLLGSVRDTAKCVIAQARQTVCPGTAAALEGRENTLGAAVLSRVSAPDMESGTQQLVFLPASQEQLAQCETGETVTVEVLVETVADCVLAPLSAVAADGRIWYVEDGKARSEAPGELKRSGESVALDANWEGRQVILLPDDARLSEGCAVKEAKAP